MTHTTIVKAESAVRRFILKTMDIIVLVAASLLILIITSDVFENISFLVDPKYLKFQFWICMIFIADVLIEMLLGRHSWRNVLMGIIFIFICIPYVNVIDYFGIKVSGEMLFVLRLLPMLRATYVIVEVMGRLNADRVTNLFRAYITLFLVVVYFSSLMFYVEEHGVNNDVDTYWSSLWWTIMTLTTAGCYITEVTTVGKILSVVLSGGGLILFPVFTVYVANAVSGTSSQTDDDSDDSDSDSDKNSSESSPQDENNANFATSNGNSTNSDSSTTAQ